MLVMAMVAVSCGRMQPNVNGSENDGLGTGGEPLTAQGTVENGLPYDGCSYPVTIAGVEYAPSAETKSIAAAFATIGKRSGTVTYRLPAGQTAEVECGWGSVRTLPEIELVSITADELTATGTVENGLPYDGCSYPVTIAGVKYAPTAATRAIAAAFATTIGKRSGTFTYRLPAGQTADVECGWGSTQTLPAIELISIAANTLTARVEIENSLPADGCSYPVKLDGIRYAPSPGSQARVQAFASSYGAHEAIITYVLTGGTATVTCGWGSQQDLPEIDVITIDW
jgi:hypothetical protein